VDKHTANGGGRSCVALRVGGHDLYLCSKWVERNGHRRKPGCAIYVGTPDDETINHDDPQIPPLNVACTREEKTPVSMPLVTTN
jgi:hypothetical protein